MKRIFIVMTALIASMVFLATSASATSQFAGSTGKSCSFCHTSPPSLNSQGQAFKANGYQLNVAPPVVQPVKPPVVQPVKPPVVVPVPAPKPVVTPTKPVTPVKVVTPTKPVIPKTNVVIIKKGILKLSVQNKAISIKKGAPYHYNGATYVPLRAIVIGMGDNISWDSKTKTVVVIKKNGAKVSFPVGKTVVNKSGIVYVPVSVVSKYLYSVQTIKAGGVTTYNVTFTNIQPNEKVVEYKTEDAKDEVENELEND